MSSAGPRQYGTSKTRTSPPTSVGQLARAPAAFVRNVRPMQNRSGRSQNVSPPSTVPGRLDAPDRRDPVRERPGLQRGWLAAPIGLARAGAGSRRGRSPAVDRRCRRGRATRSRSRGRGPRPSEARSPRTRRARGGRARGRPGAGSRGPDRRTRTERRAGPLDQHVAQAAPSCSGPRTGERRSSSPPAYPRARGQRGCRAIGPRESKSAPASGALRWAGATSGGDGGGDRLDDRDLDLQLDGVTDEPAAGLEGDVPVEVPVLAIDLGGRRKPACRAPSMPGKKPRNSTSKSTDLVVSRMVTSAVTT